LPFTPFVDDATAANEQLVRQPDLPTRATTRAPPCGPRRRSPPAP
jgi:hypothetical protein